MYFQVNWFRHRGHNLMSHLKFSDSYSTFTEVKSFSTGRMKHDNHMLSHGILTSLEI
jgi:hypothetical protein